MGTACGCGKSDAIAPTPEHKSSKSASRYSVKPSFTSVSISKSDPLKLIDGYLNEPLVSLEQALIPFDGKIDQLSYYIHEAKTKYHYPKEHNLTLDESAAICIYTMKWGNGCLYDRLQNAWKSEDPTKLKPWFKYLKLFKTGLDKLPNANTEIWQGPSYGKELKEQLSTKSLLLYSSMGSCSPSEKQLKEYLEQQDGTEAIIVGYSSVNGKSAVGYTANNSKEAILWAGTKLGAAKHFVDSSTGVLYVHLTAKSGGTSKSTVSKAASSGEHFVCPYTGCGNRCPTDHKGDHCHTFAILSHTCEHHCGPSNKCEKCGKSAHTLCKCYNCGSSYCERCCFK